MRIIKEIVVHCTATPAGRRVTVSDVDKWHKERGFRCIGYHYLIGLDGVVHPGRPESEIGAHCIGFNASSIGICYVGGLDASGQPKDTRTPEQVDAMTKILLNIIGRYPITRILGHCEVAAKACPCFDVQKEYGALVEWAKE